MKTFKDLVSFVFFFPNGLSITFLEPGKVYLLGNSKLYILNDILATLKIYRHLSNIEKSTIIQIFISVHTCFVG